ncbi:hypothetical protein F4775DRAFT_595414 [Biscogniauxia sp. FL1348]|nr:hypothetical protein F4775DRAFT_595414 [Biscogniauxia sp. FL1348]
MIEALTTGHFQENTYSELITKSKNYGPINSSFASLSLVGATRDSSLASRRPAKPLPVASRKASGCSLTSSLPLLSRSPPKPHNNAESPQLVAAGDSKQDSEWQPPILASIHRVLSADPSYAEELVSAVKQLPEDKRNLLFSRLLVAQEEDGHSRVPSGQPSSSAGATNNAEVREEAPTPPGEQSRKRHRSNKEGNGENTNHGNSGHSGGNGGDKGGNQPPPDKRQKIDQRWVCPYHLAYGNNLPVDMLIRCCQGFKERRDWKAHLKDCHSPTATGSGNRLFYMDEEQWGKVQDTIDTSSKRPCYDPTEHVTSWETRAHRVRKELHSFPVMAIAGAAGAERPERPSKSAGTHLIISDYIDPRPCRNSPRDFDPWLEVQKECFLAVWRIIFPEDRFPSLKNPKSPFHLNDGEVKRLVPQSIVLFDAIHNLKARKAVPAGTIASTRDFHPTHLDYREMMAEASAIIANNSISAAQWLINTSNSALHDAAAEHADRATDWPGVTIAPLHAQPIDAAAHEPFVGPEAMSGMGEVPDVDLLDQIMMPEPVPTHFFSVPLFPEGTQVSVRVLPNLAYQPTQQQEYVRIELPLTCKVQSFNGERLPNPV